MGGDVTAVDYTAPSGILTIPAGSSSGIITITTIDDSLRETDEDLTVRLTDATTAGREVTIDVTDGNDMASATIVASEGEILLSVSDAGTVNEGEDAVFSVELNGTLDDNLTVSYSTGDGTAEISDNDYTAIPDESLVIEAGQRSATITVFTRTDTSAENNETFNVTLTEDHIDVGIGDGEGEATIRDDDPLRANLSAPKSQVAGNDYDATVELTGGTPSANVDVTYQVVGGATATDDHHRPGSQALRSR